MSETKGSYDNAEFPMHAATKDALENLRRRGLSPSQMLVFVGELCNQLGQQNQTLIELASDLLTVAPNSPQRTVLLEEIDKTPAGRKILREKELRG